MGFENQHKEAQERTVSIRNEVSVSLFDDKVREMGTMIVKDGVITINLDYHPSMIRSEATAKFLADEIGLAIQTCYRFYEEAFFK